MFRELHDLLLKIYICSKFENHPKPHFYNFVHQFPDKKTLVEHLLNECIDAERLGNKMQRQKQYDMMVKEKMNQTNQSRMSNYY